MNSCTILLRNMMEHPEYSQRQWAEETGMSLGKVNQCIKHWEEEGYLEKQEGKGEKRNLTEKRKGLFTGTQGGCGPDFGSRLRLPLRSPNL